jgi:tripartite-type tricarboxylate transporter receptor subunit TctC
MLPRRWPLVALGFALAALAPLTVTAQERYPSRAITLVVPADAGSSLDLLGRAFAEALRSPLGQSIAVRNVPGATAGGLTQLHAAAADGYTLGVVGSFAITTTLGGGVPFGPGDLSYLAHLGRDTFVLAVPAGSPYRSLRDYLAAGSGVAPPVPIAISGKATLSHVAAGSIAQVAAMNLAPVPSAGSMASLGAILDNRVASAILVQSEVAPHVGTGRGPVILATFGDTRSTRFPGIPTAAEQNLSGLPPGPWRGLAAPPGLPQPIKATLIAAIAKAYEDPQWKAFHQRHSLSGGLRTGAELDRYLEGEVESLRLTMMSLGLLAR